MLEIIICRSVVTLFISWFYYSCFLSVCITVDEKHFCKICSSCNTCKTTTQQTAHLMWFFMWYFCQICTPCTSANNTKMHFWCHLSCNLLYFLVQLKPCTVTKSDSHICCMAISDHSGNHHIGKCSQHVCFSVWTVNCYLHAYSTEWYHLYCTLHKGSVHGS